MSKLRSTVSAMIALAVGLGLVLYSEGVGVASDGTTDNLGSPFIVESVSLQEGRLQVSIVPTQMGVELAARPVLLTEDGTHTGNVSAGGDGTLVIVFDRVTQIGYGTAIELPAVSVPSDSDFASSFDSMALTSSDGHEYRITRIERVVPEDDNHAPNAKEPGLLNVHYEPMSGGAPAVTQASISNGLSVIRALGTGTAYSPTWGVSRGVINFPLEAESLLNSGDAMIRVAQVRTVQTQRIELSTRIAS
jgi:hypothetical protein